MSFTVCIVFDVQILSIFLATVCAVDLIRTAVVLSKHKSYGVLVLDAALGLITFVSPHHLLIISRQYNHNVSTVTSL
jgi:hypothetical protein